MDNCVDFASQIKRIISHKVQHIFVPSRGNFHMSAKEISKGNNVRSPGKTAEVTSTQFLTNYMGHV